MKIVFDLDGVLRDLHGYLGEHYGIPPPNDWGWEYENKDIFAWAVKDKFRLLRSSPKTEYYDIILRYYPTPEIWTHQPEEWKKATAAWIKQYLGYDCVIRFLTNQEKRERLDLHTDTLLVEDNPNFTHYDRIVLVTRSYNKKIRTKCRVSNPKQLERIFKSEK